MRGPIICSLFILMIPSQLVAKTGPTLHPREQTLHARGLCGNEAWAIKLREEAEASAVRWVAMSDEELWDFILDADIPRALNVRFGADCPIHGTEIFRKGGHYPWIMSTDEPFKVKCPVGGEVYPTNDFAGYLKGGRKDKLDTTQKYVDDGFGWVNEKGEHYWFVAHYIFWQRWRRDILDAIASLGYAYELTGDAKYAHKAGVMLGRFVEVYPKMDYAKQAYHNGKWPAGIDGRILDYIWENGTINHLGEAYDRVYDALDGDEELKTFLASRGIADLKRDLEQKVLHFMARDIMEGRIRGNMYYQPTLARLAIVMDNEDPSYGPTKREMVDWLLYSGGEINLILYNGFDRDGAGGESAPGYSSSWNENFCTVADLLARLGVDVTGDPRWRQIIRFPYNVTLAGAFVPRLGDATGDIHSAPKIVNPTILRFGFKHFKDPQCAQLLLSQDVFGNSLWDETLKREQVEAVAKTVPEQPTLGTRDMGGYGLGVFESGAGDRCRAATMYYGGADAWHGHHDRLTVDYWAHGRCFLPEMGYPSHWDDLGERFVRGMPSHFIVEIDAKRSANKRSGYLDFFAAGSKVRVMRGRGEAVYPGVAEVYRRTFAMIDAGDESFLIDLFHVRGGQVHDYHFHGLPFGEFTTSGLELVSTQEKGTLLGEDIEWGGDKSGDQSGYDFLNNVRRYKANGVWCARWAGRDDCRLNYWMPPYPEVIVCDGKPPMKPDYPEKMEFVVVRERAEESLFPAVIAPAKGQDLVKNVRFQRDGNTMRYTLTAPDGVWTIAASADGAFSAVCAHADGSQYGFFVNQETVEFGGKRIQVEGPARYTVKSVDYDTNTVRVKGHIRRPELLVNQAAVISGHGHSASYTVAKADKHTIQFQGPAITGMCVVEGAEGKSVITKTRLSGYGTQITARNLDGMVLMNESHNGAAPIASHSNDAGGLRLDLEDPLDCPDVDADGRRLAYFGDFARDYTISFTPWLELESSGARPLAVASNRPCCVH